MSKLEKFDGTKTYATPVGGIQTPEYLLEKYPALTLGATYLIETDDEGTVALSEPMSLAQLRTHYAIDAALDDEEAIASIQDIINTPPVYEPDEQTIALASIAAQLEYQNLLTMEDANI
ncbi:MAG: hypothetical protein GX572_04370 [Clostridia bacterium]|nr:hypothetical protein [Clostridia bacterium]